MASIKQILVVVAACVVLIASLAVFATYQNEPSELLTNQAGELENFAGPYAEEADATFNLQPVDANNQSNPVAVLATSEGEIKIELFSDKMPITASNFIKLAKEGFYDKTKFHRVMANFMIQGGDPNSKGSDTSIYGKGDPGYMIKDEFVSDDSLSNVAGTIAMANTGEPNSGGSQFFINVADNTRLDWDVPDSNNSAHPVFGNVISGMDVVYKISKVETGKGNIPIEPIIIESITINE